MPLLFSILDHYNLLSKQPNYTCSLFFYDLMFMVVSWARAIMSISKKAWTFPGRSYYYILYFQKLTESPTTVRQREERDIQGPRDNFEGTSCLAGSSLIPWPCHGLGASQRLQTGISPVECCLGQEARRGWVGLSPFGSFSLVSSLHIWLLQGNTMTTVTPLVVTMLVSACH